MMKWALLFFTAIIPFILLSFGLLRPGIIGLFVIGSIYDLFMARRLIKHEVILLPLRVFLPNPTALYSQKAAPSFHTHFPWPKPHPRALNGRLVQTHTALHCETGSAQCVKRDLLTFGRFKYSTSLLFKRGSSVDFRHLHTNWGLPSHWNSNTHQQTHAHKCKITHVQTLENMLNWATVWIGVQVSALCVQLLSSEPTATHT